MINKLKLEYFRQHRDLTVDFTSGINVIRAANEGGKSTLLEAISYAMFGSHSLRTSIDDAVTWGEDTKKLRVSLALTVDSHSIIFTRSKAGAEVVVDGNVHVTGQNEVSAYAANMLGAEPKTASKLMFASQNGLRGALEEGPKALSVMIEQLADMDVFDKILEAAQDKLVLGSPALLEERLKGAEATLTAATEAMPPRPDDEAFHAELTAKANALSSIEASISSLKESAEKLEEDWLAASRKRTRLTMLESAVDSAKANLETGRRQVAELGPAAAVVVTDSRDALRAEIAKAEDHGKAIVALRIFRNLPDGERFTGNSDDFNAAMEACQTQRGNIESLLRHVERAIDLAKSRRINHDKCDKCGQDVTHLEHVIATNARVDAEIAELEPEVRKLKEALEAEVVIENRFKTIQRFATKIMPEINKLGGYVQLDNTLYPPEVAWIGNAPAEDAPDVAALKAQLTKVDSAIKAVESAQSKLDLAVSQVQVLERHLRNAEEELAGYECPTAEAFVELSDAKDKAAIDLTVANGNVILLKQEMEAITKEHDAAKALWSSAQARIDDANATIANVRKDLDSLGFNNNLVKKIRNIRPQVADKLWNTVLASVSVMFSQMRGEPSIVTKVKDGFRVNGQTVEGLSGSTLDVLGIAIRSALLRTFIPHNPLLVLDEPAQGCDSSRTEAMLGFLHGLGMGQILLVTHETVSESVADNIIQL